MIPLLLLSLTLLFCLTTVSAASGDAIYVNGSGGNDSWDGLSATHTDGTLIGPKISIKNATKTVNTNGTIHIANGQYTGENNTNMTIDKNMKIIGETQTGTIINGTGTNWIFNITSGVNFTVQNLTLTNATAAKGGAIYNEGNLTATNCTFTSNKATISYVYGGGAIYNKGTITSLSGCTFTNNKAAKYGGAVYNDGTITSLSGCNFTDNIASSYGGGGAIFNYGTLTATDSIFTGNRAYNGGAINNQGNLIATNCIFTGNSATIGGAIENWGNGAVTGSTLTDNTAYSGGAISNDQGTLIAENCTFTGNTATSEGGAIYNDDSLTAYYNRFYNNTAPNGDAIYCYSGSVDANYNWWSSNLDPKTISNLIYVINDGSVDVTYWVILSVNASPNTINNTQTSVITADLNHYTDSSGNIRTFTDHIPDVPVTFAVDANGNLDSLSGIISNGLNAATTFTATRKGLATVNATVDGFTLSQVINILNNAPTVTDDSKNTDEDTSATGQVTANDVDGDTLTYSKDTNPAHGSVTVNGDGSYIYTPKANYHGTDSFTVLVSDGNGGTVISTVSITVNSINDAPVAQNDTVNTKENKSINISVLGNDSDADGDSLTVNGVTQPNHGTAAINADGTVTYTPDENYYGPDSFTYTISDGNGGTDTATVNITVNQAVSNLYIKTTTSNQNPTTGESFVLKYKLGNKGPDEAKNVTITFQIPEGLDFVNISVDNGKYTYNETTRTVTWTLDSVPVGDPYLYLTVKAAGDGTYKITPSIISDTYNLNSGDSGIIIINVQSNNNENTVNAASKTTKTIGLQDTGLPLNYLLLAVLMVLGVLVPKRK